jgi:P-type Cu2+ transporter
MARTPKAAAHDHAAVDHAEQVHAEHDHAAHDHASMDHGTMDHASMDHSAHDHAAMGHSAHDHAAMGHDPAQFKRKFWVSLALTIPTLVFSMGLQDILGLSGPRFMYSEYIPAVFGVALFFYGGLVFLKGAIPELKAKKPGMMTLISLAILVALGYSIAVLLGFDGMDFWWELATLITIMLLGHWIEMSAVMGAQNALGELAKLIPDEAELVHDDHTMTVPVSQLSIGDHVLVRPGAAIPADGDVVDGESDVNEALLTGESAAVTKTKGATVIAGSINGSGALTVAVSKVGGDTALAGVMKMVADAQASKSGVQILADRAASLLFYVALGAAIITLAAWWLIDPTDPAFIIERVVTVLVIACPHALGLAIPLVAQLSTSIGARNGILVRNRSALEEARLIQVVLFDKTGTLTEGRQGVTSVVAAKGQKEDDVLAIAASVEAKAQHPIAMAIVAEAKSRKIKVTRATKFSAIAGLGAEATVGSRKVTVGSERLLASRSLTAPAELVNAAKAVRSSGFVYVVDGDAVVGIVAIADVIRPESVEAVATLKKAGIRVAMLTGDSHAVANAVAAELGIDEVFAEVLPGQKAEVVTTLQKGKTRVAMVGDGVNDAPALATADVGIAIGAGTDVAIESAGIVLASSDPRAVLKTIKLSKATYRKMQQNLFWATGYNAVGIPLAAGVLIFAGVTLSPALGAAFMSISTVVVALNAQLLRRLKLGS